MKTHPELSLCPETPNLRVRAKNLNFLFRNITETEFIPIYDKSTGFVRKYFNKDKFMRIHPLLNEDRYMHFTREIALHWIYYYTINNFKIKVTKDDLDHPQTYQIAMRLSEIISKDAAESHRIAAEILSISPKDYERWLKGHLKWVEMM